MKVKDCMCQNVCTCKPNASISDVAKLMGENHIGCVPVCDDIGGVVGVLTDRDILLRTVACDKDSNTTKASDIMTTNVKWCSSETDIKDASKMMCDCQVKRIPIVDNNRIVGIITLGDIASNKDISNEEIGCTTRGICNCNSYKNAE